MYAIEGKLVVLREILWSDLDDYNRWNTPGNEVHRYSGPWYSHSGTIAHLINSYFEELIRKDRPEYPSHFEIDTKVKRLHIGSVNVWQNREVPHAAEIGLAIYETSEWDSGYGSEALALLLEHLFMIRGLHRIEATTWSGNPRMIHINDKLGLKTEARIRRSIYLNGEYYDRLQVGILRENWLEIRRRFIDIESGS